MLFLLVAERPADFTTSLVAHFPNEHIEVQPGTWIISTPDSSTSQEVWDRLVGKGAPSGIIVSFVGYYGRKNSQIWEWIAAKRNVQK